MNIAVTPWTFVAAFATGAIGAYLAYRRGRNPYLWFGLGFLFGIFGLFAVCFLPFRKKSLQKAVLATSQAPEPTIQGPSDKFWYYLNPEHQQIGPMSLDALTTAWRQEKISLNTFVWNEELPEWKLLQDFVKPTS